MRSKRNQKHTRARHEETLEGHRSRMLGGNMEKADQDGVTGKHGTDKHMRDNKDHIHRHTNEGIRKR